MYVCDSSKWNCRNADVNLELLGNGRAWVQSILPKNVKMKMMCMRIIDLKISSRINVDHEFEFLIANNSTDFQKYAN